MLSWWRNLFGLDPSGDLGRRGEQLAADWLRRERRFVLVARNWRNPRDQREELDLVARDGEVLVFVEVKTRGAAALVPGFYAVNARKKRVLRRAANAYLARLREKPRFVRLDVVEVSLPSATSAKAGVSADGAAGAPEILLFENVLLFPKYPRT